MTFIASTKSSELVAVSIHTASLPAGIASGDLLLLMFCVNDAGSYSGDQVSTPTGWTLQEVNNTTNSTAYLFSKVATGAETVVSLDSIDNFKSSHASIIFRDVSFGALALSVVGTSSSMAYVALTPPAGNAEYVSWGMFEGSETVTVFPADFTIGQQEQSLLNANLSVAVSPVVASPPASNAFTLSASTNWVGFGVYVETSATANISLGRGSFVVIGKGLIVDNDISSLDTGSFTVTGRPIVFPELQRGGFNVVGYGLTSNPVFLGTGSFVVTGRTHFGSYRLTKEVVRIDWSAGTYPLACLPPANLLTGEYFGIVLVEDVAAGMSVTIIDDGYQVAGFLADHVLTRKGDYVLFRYDSVQIFCTEKYPAGSGVMTMTNDVETLSLDVSTATLADVANTLATTIKKLGLDNGA